MILFGGSLHYVLAEDLKNTSGFELLRQRVILQEHDCLNRPRTRFQLSVCIVQSNTAVQSLCKNYSCLAGVISKPVHGQLSPSL